MTIDTEYKVIIMYKVVLKSTIHCYAASFFLFLSSVTAGRIIWTHLHNSTFYVKYIYEIIHICTAVVDEVKSDHRSKFSNLSNWKE